MSDDRPIGDEARRVATAIDRTAISVLGAARSEMLGPAISDAVCAAVDEAMRLLPTKAPWEMDFSDVDATLMRVLHSRFRAAGIGRRHAAELAERIMVALKSSVLAVLARAEAEEGGAS